MVLGGLGRDEQPFPDLGVGETLAEQRQHLGFPPGERAHPRRGVDGTGPRRVTQPPQQRRGPVRRRPGPETREHIERGPRFDDGIGATSIGGQCVRELEPGDRRLQRPIVSIEPPRRVPEARRGPRPARPAAGHPAPGQRRLGVECGAVGALGRARRARRGAVADLGVAAAQLRLDGEREERATTSSVADELAESPGGDGDGEVELPAREVYTRAGIAHHHLLGVGFDQLARFVDSALVDAELGEPRGDVHAMGHGTRHVRPERFEHDLLGFLPATDAQQHGSVRDTGSACGERAAGRRAGRGRARR